MAYQTRMSSRSTGNFRHGRARHGNRGHGLKRNPVMAGGLRGRMEARLSEALATPFDLHRMSSRPHVRVGNKKLVAQLQELAQLDIDAAMAYGQALKHIDVPAIYEQLSKFRKDHLRHIVDLYRHIQRLGGMPPDFAADLKGFLIEGLTALRSLTGTVGALKAMRSNEILTNRVYKSALSRRLPPNIRDLIQANYSDEKRHLRYIEQVLKLKAWRLEEARV